jgi:multicomponent Na+:H+ antiporter subunit B
MRHHLVLRVVSKMLIPFILIFSLYVQFHGDFGPGGGFQAGVIFAAAFILYALVFGDDQARQVIPDKALILLVPAGLILYSIVGFLGILFDGSFLDYNVLLSDPVNGQHLGIFIVELGVGITVAAVMISVFRAYAGRTRTVDDEDW